MTPRRSLAVAYCQPRDTPIREPARVGLQDLTPSSTLRELPGKLAWPLLMAMRYIELHPVRAGLVDAPAVWRWSSAAAHLHSRDDLLVNPASATALVGDWAGQIRSA